MFDEHDVDVLDNLKQRKRKKTFQEEINKREISTDEMDDLFM